MHQSLEEAAIAHHRQQPDACPDCGSEHIVTGRSIFGVVMGAILVLVGFLAAFPTLCASFILSVWGVFMMSPRHRCKSCGWKKRAR